MKILLIIYIYTSEQYLQSANWTASELNIRVRKVYGSRIGVHVASAHYHIINEAALIE